MPTILLKDDVDINIRDPATGDTPLLCALGSPPRRVENYYGERATLAARPLITKGADLEIKNSHGRTALSQAAELGYFGLVEMLVERGADMASRDVLGQTPLFYALENNCGSVISFLLERYPNLFYCRDDFGRSPHLLVAEQQSRASSEGMGNALRHDEIVASETEAVLNKIRSLDSDLSGVKGGKLFTCKWPRSRDQCLGRKRHHLPLRRRVEKGTLQHGC
jgi:hypothetical protein